MLTYFWEAVADHGGHKGRLQRSDLQNELLACPWCVRMCAWVRACVRVYMQFAWGVTGRIGSIPNTCRGRPLASVLFGAPFLHLLVGPQG